MFAAVSPGTAPVSARLSSIRPRKPVVCGQNRENIARRETRGACSTRAASTWSSSSAGSVDRTATGNLATPAVIVTPPLSLRRPRLPTTSPAGGASPPSAVVVLLALGLRVAVVVVLVLVLRLAVTVMVVVVTTVVVVLLGRPRTGGLRERAEHLRSFSRCSATPASASQRISLIATRDRFGPIHGSVGRGNRSLARTSSGSVITGCVRRGCGVPLTTW